MRSVFSGLVVLLLGLALVGWATNGFRALTSEQARRADVATQPVLVPDTDLLLANGDIAPLRTLVSEGKGSTIVGFFYSSCRSICITLGHDFSQLQTWIAERGLENHVNLLSISFDPTTDTAPILQAYENRVSAQDDIWTIAAVARPQDLPQLLAAFGIRAIDDKQGGFIHNSAFHIVNAAGELEAIVDLGHPQTAMRRALGKQPQ